MAQAAENKTCPREEPHLKHFWLESSDLTIVRLNNEDGGSYTLRGTQDHTLCRCGGTDG